MSIITIFLTIQFSLTFSAELRPIFTNPIDLLIPQASEIQKVLQKPIAFSYTKPEDSVIKVQNKRENPITKLDTKRILKPKSKRNSKSENHYKTEEFNEGEIDNKEIEKYTETWFHKGENLKEKEIKDDEDERDKGVKESIKEDDVRIYFKKEDEDKEKETEVSKVKVEDEYHKKKYYMPLFKEGVKDEDYFKKKLFYEGAEEVDAKATKYDKPEESGETKDVVVKEEHLENKDESVSTKHYKPEENSRKTEEDKSFFVESSYQRPEGKVKEPSKNSHEDNKYFESKKENLKESDDKYDDGKLNEKYYETKVRGDTKLSPKKYFDEEDEKKLTDKYNNKAPQVFHESEDGKDKYSKVKEELKYFPKVFHKTEDDTKLKDKYYANRKRQSEEDEGKDSKKSKFIINVENPDLEEEPIKVYPAVDKAKAVEDYDYGYIKEPADLEKPDLYGIQHSEQKISEKYVEAAKEDLKSSASKKPPAKPKNEKHDKGGGKEFDAKHFKEHKEEGEKKYEGKHTHNRKEFGHHDKEAHDGSYKDGGGHEKKEHHESDYHGEHHKGDKGEKGAKYDEEGKHDKGHSTKGTHNVHKNDEYEKKEEFYDEYHEEDGQEKAGGFFEDDEHKKGGDYKKGHLDSGSHHDHYGKEKHYEKGQNFKDDKGHKKADGYDGHHDYVDKYKKLIKKEGDKKWLYKHGGA